MSALYRPSMHFGLRQTASGLSIRGENLFVADDLAYVARTPVGLPVIDVAAKAEPSSTASYRTPYHAFDVDVHGSIIAVADSDHDLSGEGGILFMGSPS